MEPKRGYVKKRRERLEEEERNERRKNKESGTHIDLACALLTSFALLLLSSPEVNLR
jgi:hypothetical protein